MTGILNIPDLKEAIGALDQIRGSIAQIDQPEAVTGLLEITTLQGVFLRHGLYDGYARCDTLREMFIRHVSVISSWSDSNKKTLQVLADELERYTLSV